MHSKTPMRMQVIRKEEKEAKLRDYIAADMAGVLARGEAGVAYLLVARSSESPVVRALTALWSEIEKNGIAVRAVFLSAERSPAGPLPTAVPMRWARNPRLADAHEQLVLGGSTVWIGDSMRRDPAKRDAFECYATDCTRTAHWARVGFTRLWGASEPLRTGRLIVPVAPVEVSKDLVPPDQLQAKPDGERPIVSTRH